MPVPYTRKRKRHNPEKRAWRGASYKKSRGAHRRYRVRDLRDVARRAADARGPEGSCPRDLKSDRDAKVRDSKSRFTRCAARPANVGMDHVVHRHAFTMTITFTALDTDRRPLASGEREPATACLCAQMASSWEMYLDGSDRAELAACAAPTCSVCGGAGVEPGYERVYEINFANCTGGALLGLLGLESPVGEATLPIVRRAILRARATFARRAPQFTYEHTEGGAFAALTAQGRLEIVHEGNVACIVRGPRVIAGNLASLDVEGLGGRLEAFAAFIERAAQDGAEAIQWG